MTRRPRACVLGAACALAALLAACDDGGSAGSPSTSAEQITPASLEELERQVRADPTAAVPMRDPAEGPRDAVDDEDAGPGRETTRRP